jgi:hypothetical protein
MIAPNFKAVLLMLISFSAHCLLLSCRSTANQNASGKDIGLVNAADAKSGVLYEEQGKVYFKMCKPVVMSPKRDCSSDEAPKVMPLADYLYKLPFDVGAYQRDDQALQSLTKAVQDARAAVAAGNQAAANTLTKIESFKLNLETILKVRDGLAANNQDLTYYEYQDEFDKLVSPFLNGSGRGGVGGTPPNGRHATYPDESDASVDIPAGTIFRVTQDIIIPSNTNFFFLPIIERVTDEGRQGGVYRIYMVQTVEHIMCAFNMRYVSRNQKVLKAGTDITLSGRSIIGRPQEQGLKPISLLPDDEENQPLLSCATLTMVRRYASENNQQILNQINNTPDADADLFKDAFKNFGTFVLPDPTPIGQ